MKKITSSQELLSTLQTLLTRQRLVLFTAGLLVTVASVVGMWLVLALVAQLMIVPVWLKISLLALVGVTAIGVFGRYAMTRLFQGSPDGIAVALEQRYPELEGRLVAALQFARGERTPGYSQELMDLTLTQAIDKSGLMDFNEVLSFRPLWRYGRHLVAAGIAVALAIVLIPGLFSHSLDVYGNPTREIAPPIGYNLAAYPGSTEWVKYRDVEIGAALTGDRLPDKARIHHRLAGGSWQVSEVDLKKQPLFSENGIDSVRFGVTLRQVNKSFDYWVEAGRVQTEVHKVDVVDRPRVEDIKLSIFYPDYTELSPTVIDENDGSFSALVGSRVNVDIETNVPVEDAQLWFNDSVQVPMDVTGKKATSSLVVGESQAYTIRLKDHLGEANPDPIEYYMTAVPDEYPSIDVVKPGFDVNLNDDMMIPFTVRIYDDYGFSGLNMKYMVVNQGRPSDETVAVLHYSDKIKTEGDIEFNWDLDPLNMYPGDYVVYHFEVTDNDNVSGPKTSSSRKYIARLPSLDEIIAQSEAESQQRINRTEDILETSKELAERLKKAVRKMQAEGNQDSRAQQNKDWQQQKELESITNQNEEMLKNIDELAEKMKESLEKMSNTSLMSREMLQKMEQIQKLYEEVATPEMREAQKRLAEAMENLDRDQIMKAMEDMQMSQEEMMDRLDRTLALLKKLQAEQKMEAMLQKAEELVRKQEEMNDKTDASEPSDLPSKSEDEQKLAQELQDLKQEVSELQEMLKEAKIDQLEPTKEFSEALEKTDADKNMEQMSEAMKQQDKPEASDQGDEALSKMTEMLDKMQQQMAQMKGENSEALERAYKDAIKDAGVLSKSQEDLLKKAAEIDPRSMALREHAANQQDLMGACNGLRQRIDELGKASPFLANELKQLLNEATRQMDMAITSFDDRRGPQGNRNQREAMAKLNEAAVRMMESLDQQKQCNNPSAMCSNPTQKLQEMTEQQNKLNNQTQQQCDKPGGSSPKQGDGSQTGREGLERLAQEQAAIRKSLQDLAREFGDSRQILGRLDDIAREMQKVEEELSTGEAGEQTTERQLRIYSRMLQATRSLQRKDYTDQRQATTATTEQVYLPDALPGDLLNDQGSVEDRLRRFLGDNYPKQYEKQIKAYFKALLEAETKAAQNAAPSGGTDQ